MYMSLAAIVALNSGDILAGVQRAGAAAARWGSTRAAALLRELCDRAARRGDQQVVAAVQKQLAWRHRRQIAHGPRCV